MPKDSSMSSSMTGAPGAAGKTRKPRLESRRLHFKHINIVNPGRLRKALGGTIVGNTMEWFDVGVFGYLITTMGPVFLPEADKSVQTLFLLGTFAVTFIARPVGGVFFGWLGDKVGRQRVLAWTLIMMAASTFVVGLLPGYAQIGIWAAVLLVVTKLIQGFSTGGEYAGATTFVSEHSPDSRRGYFASWLDVGSYLGFALGAAVVSVLQLTLGQHEMEAWAWRLPFLIAGPLGLIAIWFRNKIEESPAFTAAQDAQEVASASNATASEADISAEASLKTPVGIFKAYWRGILASMICVAAANTVAYTLTSYMPTYLTTNRGYDEVHGTLLTIPILVVMSLAIPFAGRLSDKIGRRPTMWIGAGSAVVLSIPAFLLIGDGKVWTTMLGLAMIAFPVVFYVSNIASALPAQFPTASRYGAMGIAYNFAVAIFGGTAPFIIAWLIDSTDDLMMPAYYLVGTSFVGGIAIYFLKESSQRHLPGSMPSVDSVEAAHDLVASQDDNPLLDMNELPFDHTYEPADAVEIVADELPDAEPVKV
ncbi:MFS transporter [Pengzhenrongella sp.]|jgi:MHS family proline/betaine transporter-like MFS transporter|uniref:MFS transporter n=1 Tax=Pengzhenrongella sp. TaxID=2888820 RepID=UPI002F93DFA0